MWEQSSTQNKLGFVSYGRWLWIESVGRHYHQLITEDLNTNSSYPSEPLLSLSPK